MKLYPPKEGLKHEWQPGEVAVYDSHGFPHVLILEPAPPAGKTQFILCLHWSGCPDYRSVQSLLTIEGALKMCEYMRDDWTGKEYHEAVELVRTGLPFEVPRTWGPDFMSRVLEPVAPEHALAVRKALDLFHEF